MRSADRGVLPSARELAFPSLDELPEPPSTLDKLGAAMWRTLGAKLLDAGVLRATDVYAFEQLCMMWQAYKKDRDHKVTLSQLRALRSLWREFNLTPKDLDRFEREVGQPVERNIFSIHTSSRRKDR